MLRTFQHSLVPGLLQDEEDYARAVLSTKSGATEVEIEADVAERLGRQRFFTHGRPPPPTCPTRCSMRASCTALSHCRRSYTSSSSASSRCRDGRNHYQIVSYASGGHSGVGGAFIIADLPTEQSIVFMEGVPLVAGLPSMARRFERRSLQASRSEALPKAASRDVIAKVALGTMDSLNSAPWREVGYSGNSYGGNSGAEHVVVATWRGEHLQRQQWCRLRGGCHLAQGQLQRRQRGRVR